MQVMLSQCVKIDNIPSRDSIKSMELTFKSTTEEKDSKDLILKLDAYDKFIADGIKLFGLAIFKQKFTIDLICRKANQDVSNFYSKYEYVPNEVISLPLMQYSSMTGYKKEVYTESKLSSLFPFPCIMEEIKLKGTGEITHRVEVPLDILPV